MRKAWSETLQVKVEQVEGYPCVRLTGEGECAGAEVLEGVIQGLLDDGQHRVVLDTRDVRFLNQRCYEALEAAVRNLEEEGGLMVVVDQSLPVERTLKLLDIERLVHVVPSVSQATAYLDWHE
jgi:anti-anti-sigma factor